SDLEQETYSTLESELLIEGWNAEIVVTTFIQFFYSLLGSRASQLRKLHNIAGSIVILDEVQSLPAEWWQLIRETIKFLADKFNMYFVLMTATQPLIFKPDEIYELVDSHREYFEKPRVTLKIDQAMEPLELEQFKQRIIDIITNAQGKSVMILLNTINSAKALYTFLNERGLPLEFLSAEVLPRERLERIKSIKNMLKEGRQLVLVTTQVVEAGVDIDFQLVVRDMGPVDSIIQAAGRCNRNGLSSNFDSIVWVIEGGDQGRAFSRRIYGNYLIEKSKETLSEWKSWPNMNFGTLAKIYYEKVVSGLSEVSSTEVLNALKELKYDGLQEFKIIEEQPELSVFIEHDLEAKKVWTKYTEIVESKEKGPKRREEFLKIRNALYRYVINVPIRYASNLEERLGFRYVPFDSLELFYDSKTGFRREGNSAII
ncbi:MAG: CRISPR-associated helicase Cas3', partial [archaeon]|nr:CRISPR-associated helicase Cas3' [archaeon]